MQKTLIFSAALFFLVISTQSQAQTIASDNEAVQNAYELAIKTIDLNTRNGILAAGAQYGGEWTRDISINVWSGVSMIRPGVSSNSLWDVTEKRNLVGHQFWDKILWVKAAYTHFLATGDKEFLKEAYNCSANTMTELENTVFDKQSNLFMGPSVFNDGIAGYEEPIYESGNPGDNVLNHKPSLKIKCLSTNAAYCMAYQDINSMHRILYGNDHPDALKKADKLKAAIRKNLYDEAEGRLNYFIDPNGKVHRFQEALGISYAILSGIVTPDEGLRITRNCVKSQFGITSVYPDFKRFSKEKPGRHNNLIWPMVGGTYGTAAMKAGNKADFDREFFGLISLALDGDKGNWDFYEIFNPNTGRPDGGWQAGHDGWESCIHQTWSATAYLRMTYNCIAGINLEEEGIRFTPYLPEGIHYLKLSDLRYQQMNLTIELKGQGNHIAEIRLNDRRLTDPFLSNQLTGKQKVVIILK